MEVRATRNGWLTAGAALVLALLYGTTPGTGAWARNVLSGTRLMYERRNTSPDTRAAALLGDPYRLIQKARETPPASRILIPSGAEFAPVSNQIWCAYYLYPREIVPESTLKGPPVGRVDYALIYRGSLLRLLGEPADSIRGTETGLYVVTPDRKR